MPVLITVVSSVSSTKLDTYFKVNNERLGNSITDFRIWEVKLRVKARSKM